MKRTRSKLAKSSTMPHCAIALMAGKTIARMLPFHLAHNRISGCFCQHGGGSNAQGLALAFGQRKVRIGQPRPVDVIEQQIFRG